MSLCQFCPWPASGRPGPCPGETDPAACCYAAEIANRTDLGPGHGQGKPRLSIDELAQHRREHRER